MKWFIAIVTMFMLAGCGADWFPAASTSTSSTPIISAPFTPVTDAVSGAPTTSNPVVVTGGSVNGWPISIIGGAYSINGVAYTSVPGTILPNQNLTVQITASTTINGTVTASLTIGTAPNDIVQDFVVTTTQ